MRMVLSQGQETTFIDYDEPKSCPGRISQLEVSVAARIHSDPGCLNLPGIHQNLDNLFFSHDFHHSHLHSACFRVARAIFVTS